MLLFKYKSNVTNRAKNALQLFARNFHTLVPLSNCIASPCHVRSNAWATI